MLIYLIVIKKMKLNVMVEIYKDTLICNDQGNLVNRYSLIFYSLY